MKRLFTKLTFALVNVMLFSALLNAQSFLHADGTNIIDANGNNFIARSIGTGNWMIMEGYMMKTSDAGIGTHTAFRTKLESEIGKEKTATFYDAWLDNHFTKADVDSMKAWGFNAVRPALHYRWFTLPIEEEPVLGEQTWLESGFIRLDSLIAWCTANEMYVMLDMHGAPGGQGKNADISDYDPSKPSLWESEYNKEKLVALWHKIAERYRREPYIGGYDMINEINWDFANSGNENGCNCTQNQPMIDIFTRIIDTIRLVDQNHMVFVSGNCWGNKYDGLDVLASLDDNLAYTFHKYWNYNDENAVDWITERRDRLNVPLWMSESGENSNTWYTNAIRLFEDNNIGWSWWPVKKNGINNVMEVSVNEGYQKLLKYWETGSPAMTEEEIFDAVMGWAENHKLENTFIHYDVIDAVFRQIYSYESKAFKNHSSEGEIFFADYDLGRNNVAYFDTDTSNYHVSTGEYVTWNPGWSYRNDGVGIEACSDELTNGFNVGWTEPGEWMQYTIQNEKEAAYEIEIRSAGNGGKIKFMLNGSSITKAVELPSTGGWQKWESTTVKDVILPKGTIKLRVFIDESGSNLNYFSLKNAKPADSIAFEFVAAETTIDGKSVNVSLNKLITSLEQDILPEEFILSVDDVPVAIQSVSLMVSPTNIVTLNHDQELYSGNKLTLSYNGSSVKSGTQLLSSFNDELVNNMLPFSHIIPARIQAEDFYFNNGFVRESCEDEGLGYNMGYANAGDYLDYLVFVRELYLVKGANVPYVAKYRVASEKSSSTIILQMVSKDEVVDLDTVIIKSTGGWQAWETVASEVLLTAGMQKLRFYVKSGEFNINWLEFDVASGVDENQSQLTFNLYPNPAKGFCTLLFDESSTTKTVEVVDYSGRVVYSQEANENTLIIDVSDFQAGVYFVKVSQNNAFKIQKLVVN